MKLTIQKSSVFVAIAMTIYTLLRIVVRTSFYIDLIEFGTREAIWLSCKALLLFSIIVLGISLFINRKQIPLLSKSLKNQALIIGLFLIFEIIINIIESNYFWWFSVLPYYRSNTIILLFITIWFWQFAFFTPKRLFSSKYLGKTSLVISTTLVIVLLLMLISFIHVLFTGSVIGLRLTYLISWITPISLCLFYSIYLLDLSKNKKKDLTSQILNIYPTYSANNKQTPRNDLLIRFFRNEKDIDAPHSLESIINFSNEEMERYHDFIQWIFRQGGQKVGQNLCNYLIYISLQRLSLIC